MDNNYQKLLNLGCKIGDIELVSKLYENNLIINDNFYTNNAFIIACKHGQLQMCQWLYENRPKFNYCAYGYGSMKLACKNGHLNVCKWLYSIYDYNDRRLFNDISIYTDDTDIQEWLNTLK
jgi:ankyrin repeat protein